MNAFNLEPTRLLMASNILEKETLSLVGLFLYLICQVLPLLLLSSIQIMQIKYLTDSLSCYLTFMHVILVSYTAHMQTPVSMSKYLQDGSVNALSKSTKGMLVFVHFSCILHGI